MASAPRANAVVRRPPVPISPAHAPCAAVLTRPMLGCLSLQALVGGVELIVPCVSARSIVRTLRAFVTWQRVCARAPRASRGPIALLWAVIQPIAVATAIASMARASAALGGVAMVATSPTCVLLVAGVPLAAGAMCRLEVAHACQGIAGPIARCSSATTAKVAAPTASVTRAAASASAL